MFKMFKDKKKRKKLIIITILVIIVLAFILTKIFGEKPEEVPTFDVADIETKTLTTSISSTGKIATENSKTVTSQLVNYKVTGVNVKVGDKVNVGDVLCTFDTATLAKTVSDLQATINAGNATSDITVASAERAVQDARRSRDTALDELNKNVQLLKQDFENHEAALNTARADLQTNEQQLNNLNSQVPALQAAVKSAETTINAAKIARDSASATFTQKEAEVKKLEQDLAKTDQNQLEVIGKLQNDLTGAMAQRDTAKNELQVKEKAFEEEKGKFDAATGNLNNVTGQINSTNAKIAELRQSVSMQEGAVNAKRDAYVSAQNSYNDQSASLNNQVANVQGQLDSARIQNSVSTLTTQEQLTAYQKQLDETNLKSTVSGTVTSIIAKAGDYYTGGALLTIEGVESFIVETEIDEYDIADIKEGMEVTVKTDATRDEELSGKVIAVAPASTASSTNAAAMSGMSGMSSAATGSSSATYTVKIELTTQNERLRLGMNAKLNIITNKSENALVVPYDAINEKEDGTKVITIVKDDNSEEELKVTTGLESGYYTEISSDKIKAGMKVKIPKIDGDSTVDELLNSMGATAGM